MDKKTSKILLKRVKQLSKWTEGVFVNPVFWDVDGKPYYMAGFTLQKRVIATAYLTPAGGETREEALEAQRRLSLFSDISNNLLTAGNARLQVKSSYFTSPLAIGLSNADPDVRKGREAFEEMWKIQQEFEQLAKQYRAFFARVLDREQLKEADVRFTQEQANLAAILQYRTLRELVDHNAEIHAFTAYLKTTGGYTKLSRQEREFLKTIAGTKAQMQQNLDNLGLIEDPDIEKMKTLNLARHKKLNEQEVIAQQKAIRYPL